MIQDRILRLQSHISSICQRLGRNPKEIILVGVTKIASVEGIEEAIACGVTHIAENKVQEAQKKLPALKKTFPRVTFHMIGHLQTNKVKAALELFDMIQSVDSLKLAQEIEKQAKKLERYVDILVQVNTSGEEQKYGIDPEHVFPLIEEIAKFKWVRMRGLMAMAPLTDDKKMIRNSFRELKEIRDKVAEIFQGFPNVEMKYLSMGMTDDYGIAIEEGSNMLRIGRGIFA